MKIVRKIALALAVLLVAVLGGGYLYLHAAYPNVGEAPDIRVEATPARLARGEYLATHVAGCIDCHSTRDYTRFAAPMVPGTAGKGGEKFGEEMGFPGTFYSPNITPHHLGDWTDGEVYRAITAGISKDGRPLFPVMPYADFGKMDKEDIYSIIAYIRTLEPVVSEVPVSEANFPMNLIMRTIPAEPAHTRRPSPSNTVEYGRYLVGASGCMHCHTPMEKGEPLPGMAFAGGGEFALPGGMLRAVNITPDVETGIGSWTEDMFVQRFKMYVDSSYVEPKIGPTDFNTIMPWLFYAGMEERDLRAMYAYLKTVKPVKNKVERFTPKQ
ncbi:MAG: cytochrome c [Bacteroidota bacterium]|jgi:mono/diheme cytochrome c family protein|nr:cytochrome c [Bacteroidota bacterium]